MDALSEDYHDDITDTYDKLYNRGSDIRTHDELKNAMEDLWAEGKVRAGSWIQSSEDIPDPSFAIHNLSGGNMYHFSKVKDLN